MRDLRVVNIRTEAGPESRILAADFLVGNRKREVWFRTDDDLITDTADPFVPVALIPAMRRNWALTIDGSVSPTLLEGTQHIQEIMTRWYPDFHRVSIQATSKALNHETGQRSVATFFSGGVDSFYTLQQHRDEISHLIFVHGFDVPLKWMCERRRISNSIRELATLLGLQLVEVETNLRQFGQPHVSWPKAYAGAALAAVALLLAPRFARVYLPATVSAAQLEPLGTHPELDSKWTNGALRLIHDGLATTRVEKLRSIGDWLPVQSHLRVCYQRNAKGLNCGRCQKCLWMMMTLSAAGYLDTIKTFDTPLDLDALQLYPPVLKNERDRFEEALVLLKERDVNSELQSVLQVMLDVNGRPSLTGRVKQLIARSRIYLAHRLPG